MSEQSLYQRIVGARYGVLPAAVQAMHAPTEVGVRRARGRCDISGAQGWLARLCARVAGLPPSAEQLPVTVLFTEQRGGELWQRWFGTHFMVSRQWQAGELLMERVGPARFAFQVQASAQGLTLLLRGFWVLGMPVPKALYPQVLAEESERDGRFYFDVGAALPGVGTLVHYRGYLEFE